MMSPSRKNLISTSVAALALSALATLPAQA